VSTYRVNIPKLLWFSATVEADSPDEAIDMAYEIAPSLCATCSGWGREWAVDEDDWGAISDLHPNLAVTVEVAS
jgi:hypothetical protein